MVVDVVVWLCGHHVVGCLWCYYGGRGDGGGDRGEGGGLPHAQHTWVERILVTSSF